MVSLSLFAAPLALLVVAQTPLSDAQRRAEAQRHFDAGEKNMREEAFEIAAREFAAAVELDPLMVLGHYNLGQARMALKRYPEAVQAYLGCRNAIRDLNTLEQGQVIEREREIDDQVRELQAAIRLVRKERSTDTGNKQMMLEERVRMLEATRRRGGREIRAEPGELPLALGSAYLRQGLLPDAEREYRQALSADNKMGAAHNNLAVIYMLSARFDAAHEAIRNAERCGFPVSPGLKSDLVAREKSASAR